MTSGWPQPLWTPLIAPRAGLDAFHISLTSQLAIVSLDSFVKIHPWKYSYSQIYSNIFSHHKKGFVKFQVKRWRLLPVSDLLQPWDRPGRGAGACLRDLHRSPPEAQDQERSRDYLTSLLLVQPGWLSPGPSIHLHRHAPGHYII